MAFIPQLNLSVLGFKQAVEIIKKKIKGEIWKHLYSLTGRKFHDNINTTFIAIINEATNSAC